MIVETATITRRDGTEIHYGRERARKLFVLLTETGEPDPSGLGYSRQSLDERPQKDRSVVDVAYCMASEAT